MKPRTKIAKKISNFVFDKTFNEHQLHCEFSYRAHFVTHSSANSQMTLPLASNRYYLASNIESQLDEIINSFKGSILS